MVEEKKEADPNQLELLKKIILKKLNSIKHKKFEDGSLNEFSLALRVFLLKFLKLNYEFTDEELYNELNRMGINKTLKERIMNIADLLEEIKYKDKKITKKEFNNILNEGVEIIKLATHSREDKAEKIAEEKPVEKPLFSILKKLKDKINEIFK